MGLELGLDRELAEEGWDLGQSWGQSSGAGAELGGTSGCTSPVPQSPCSLCEGCLGCGSGKQRLAHGAWHRRAVQGGKGLWDAGGAQGLGQALVNRGPHQGWK